MPEPKTVNSERALHCGELPVPPTPGGLALPGLSEASCAGATLAGRMVRLFQSSLCVHSRLHLLIWGSDSVPQDLIADQSQKAPPPTPSPWWDATKITGLCL